MTSTLILQQKRDDGCTWYRLQQFAKYAKQDHKMDVAWMRWCMPEEQLALMFDAADAFITRMSERTLGNIRQIKQYMPEKPVILDIDDSYDDISPLSNHYSWLGTQEVKLDDGKWLWKDKENGFDVEANKQRVKNFEEAARLADAMTVTTFPLRNYALQFNPNVAVIPNAIDLRYYPEIDIRKDSKRIDVVWSGGSSHFEDLQEILPALKEIMEVYPNVHYHHVGNAFPFITKSLPKDRVHEHGWLHPEAHGYRLTTLNADIGICPLTDRTFNTYKSSVKYYEYAAAGMATIAKNMSPYMDDIVHDQNGLLYDTVDGFKDALRNLVEDPIKRMTLAAEGRKYVEKHRNIQTITKDWVTLVEGLKDEGKR